MAIECPPRRGMAVSAMTAAPSRSVTLVNIKNDGTTKVITAAWQQD